MKRALFTLAALGIISGAFAGQVMVKFDPRIELLGVVNFLARHGENSQIPQDNVYIREISENFGKFKSHAAVEDLRQVRAAGIPLDALIDLMFLLDPTDLSLRDSLENFYAQLKIPRQRAETLIPAFLQDLRDFYSKTDFQKFYTSHDSFYHQITEPLQKVFAAQKIPAALEQFFGVKKSGYLAITAPLFDRVYLSRHHDSCFVVLVPTRSEDDMPHFCPHFSPFIVQQKVAYCFASDIVDSHWDRFKSSAALFVPIAESMRKQKIADWRECLKQHIAYVALAETQPDDIRAQLELISGARGGFLYLLEIADLVEMLYLPNRDKYPTFGDFAPELARHLEDLTKIPPQDFSDRVSARITAEITDIWNTAVENCRQLHFPTISALVKLDMESYLSQARKVLTCFLETSPHQDDEHYWIVKYQLGKVEFLSGNLDSAEAIFNDYIRNQPDGELLAGAYWRLGLIAEQKGDIDAAEKYYKKALEIDPNLLQAKQSLNNLYRGGGKH